MAESKTDIYHQIRTTAENDFVSFVKLVAPKQVLGGVHVELARWWTRQEAKTHQIVLLPRDHAKSRMVAFRVAWAITKRPEIRILYISSTSNLAEKQLKFIQDILTSPIYRRYWPEMVNENKNNREKWTNSEISVDHPRRKEEGVRDPTVFTGGLTTSLTGLHCDIAVMDDVVVYENAYTEEGRNKVASQYSLLSSIQGAESQVWVVGTRYHPKDLYANLVTMSADIYSEKGDIIGTEYVYELFERAVEDQGDGNGQFLWPRQQRSDGKWFGFDANILARKRAEYLDKAQFRAQYYNDPNDPGENSVNRSCFQYYEKKHLSKQSGFWFFRNKRLNVYASVDFATSTSKRSDFTVICVVGMDEDRNYFILDIDRFKTDRIRDIYERILSRYQKWEFQRLIADGSSNQNMIVTELKDSYLKQNGIILPVTVVKNTRHSGAKHERIAAILEPRYDNNSMFHYQGGNCDILEEELVTRFPPHDDCKDALALVVEHLIPPSSAKRRMGLEQANTNVKFHPRFGGVSF